LSDTNTLSKQTHKTNKHLNERTNKQASTDTIESTLERAKMKNNHIFAFKFSSSRSLIKQIYKRKKAKEQDCKVWLEKKKSQN
jgi:hypothetical protein